MKKSIFLTGNKKVGKTTLINRSLSNLQPLRIAGFRTLPLTNPWQKPGYGMQAVFSEEQTAEPVPIAFINTDGGLESFPETFDNTGVKILKESLNSRADIVLMDELGFLEKDALLFQDWVFKCLNSHIPVLGVIKPHPLPFLNKIRQRKDIELIEVTMQNRDQLLSLLLNLLSIATVK